MSLPDPIITRMQALGVQESDLVEKFIHGTGSGGQKINKTSSCVYLKHLPTGIEIKCQQDRSRESNRINARKELCERLEKKAQLKRFRAQQEREKKRRQTRQRSKRQKARMLDNKSKHSQKKQLRRKPSSE